MVTYVTGCYRLAPQRTERKHLLFDAVLIVLQDRIHLRPSVQSAYQRIFVLFLDETYVVGIQKDSLIETVLAPKTGVKTNGLENITNFTLKSFVYLNLCIKSAKFPKGVTTHSLSTRMRSYRVCPNA